MIPTFLALSRRGLREDHHCEFKLKTHRIVGLSVLKRLLRRKKCVYMSVYAYNIIESIVVLSHPCQPQKHLPPEAWGFPPIWARRSN